MKIIGLVFVVLTLASCAPSAPTVCASYERTAVGSGCRDTASGQFVDPAKCGDC
jgi:hypothetical protein